jgi:hypothetical protein
MSGRARAFTIVLAGVFVVVLIVILAVIAQPDGTAQPPVTATTKAPAAQTTTVPAATTSRLLPPRPRDIDVTGLDPCKALTFAQEKELEYDTGWQDSPVPDHDGISGAPNCSYQSRSREFGSLIAFVTNADAEVWLTDPSHKPELTPKKVTVSGFPALQITVRPTEPLPDKCKIIVDVHDGQYIDVFSSKLVGGGVTGSKTYCEEAKKVAAMVIANTENR